MVGSVALVGLTLGAVYALMAMGLTFVYGITRVFNFAQGSFFIWGAYISYLFTQNTDLPMGLILIITTCIMFGWGLAYERALIYPLRRFADWGTTAMIVTLGSALFLDSLALRIFGSRPKTLPPLIPGKVEFGAFTIQIHDILTIVILSAVVIALAQFLGKSRAGMAMRGAAQDIIGANIVGIPINRVFGNAFAITAALAGIAGTLLAPRTMMTPWGGWSVLIKALVVIVFGGLGSIKGSLIAAFVLSMVESFVTYNIGGQWGLPIFLIVALAVLVVRPRGLFGQW